jgi:hypothetical protein
MKRHVVALAALFGLMQMPAQAADWYMDLAYADGGDELATVILEDDEGDLSSEDITAGGGLSFSVGFNHHFTENFSAQASYGYKEEAVRADNGSSTFKRNTLDILAFFEPGNWRLGGGFTNEMSPKLHVKFLDLDYNFDDANGRVLEVGYKFTDFFIFAVRHTMIDYDATISVPGVGSFEHTFDGDNTSIRAEFVF